MGDMGEMSKPTDYGLSRLGQEAAESDSGFVFKILKDVWHPKNNPNGFVIMGIAENNLMHETIADYIRKNMTISQYSLTYGEGGMGSPRTRNAIARFLNRHLKPIKPLDKSHIIVTNGLSPAIEHCSQLLSDPDDVILLGQPHYGAFTADIQFRPKTELVLVPFGDIDPVSFSAVKCYESVLLSTIASGKKVKGLVLCHPHNPLGRCYPRPAIIELMRLCQKHNVHFISDEIYALSVWKNNIDTNPPPVPYESALSIDTTDIIAPHLVHVLWGMSKDFAANGIRIGCIISQSNPDFIKALEVVSLYSFPSSMADDITGTILLDDTFTDQYITTSQRLLSESYSRSVKLLQEHKIEYMPGANAAFFLWVNLGQAYADRHPESATRQEDIDKMIMDSLLEHKVFLASGDRFGSEKPGWFRIVFAQHEEYLIEGLKRVVAALDQKDPGNGHTSATHAFRPK